MMLRFTLALTVVLAPLAYGYEADSPYPTIPVCNKKTVSDIKSYWKTAGTPSNVLKKIENNGPMAVLQTSYKYKNEHNKCIFLKMSNDILNVSFVPQEGKPPAYLNYKIEVLDDGVIKGHPRKNDAPEFRWNWYPIFSGDGVEVLYACSDVEGSQDPPVASILVSKGSYQNSLARAVTTKMTNLLDEWGFKFIYNYGSECINTEYLKAF